MRSSPRGISPTLTRSSATSDSIQRAEVREAKQRQRDAIELRHEAARRAVEEQWPLLTHFYGISPLELAELPKNITLAYLKAMPRLQAMQQQADIEAAAYPHLERSAQKQISRRLSRMTRRGLPKTEEAQAPKSLEETKKTAAAIGFGVVEVKDA